MEGWFDLARPGSHSKGWQRSRKLGICGRSRERFRFAQVEQMNLDFEKVAV